MPSNAPKCPRPSPVPTTRPSLPAEHIRKPFWPTALYALTREYISHPVLSQGSVESSLVTKGFASKAALALISRNNHAVSAFFSSLSAPFSGAPQSVSLGSPSGCINVCQGSLFKTVSRSYGARAELLDSGAEGVLRDPTYEQPEPRKNHFVSKPLEPRFLSADPVLGEMAPSPTSGWMIRCLPSGQRSRRGY